MRMRKKKNLETRLSAVSDYILDLPLGEERDFNKAIEEKALIDYEKIFGNKNPVRMEIGCGRGQFTAEIAKRNPDVNFIAVEKVLNVIVLACEKAKKEGLTNIKYLIMFTESQNGAGILPKVRNPRISAPV